MSEQKENRRKAFLVSLPLGAVLGLAFGYANRNYHSYALHAWWNNFPGEALFWMAAGAFAAGCAICLWNLLHTN